MVLKSRNNNDDNNGNKLGFITEKLSFLEGNDLYRHLRSVQVCGSKAIVNGHETIHFCSNDYLGLSQDQTVIRKAVDYLHEISQCSSRLIAGNNPIFLQLEQELAKHRKTEDALVYPTGYSANLGAITSIADKNTVIFSDELNHASIIDACRLSGAKIKIFDHNNVDHLGVLLERNGHRNVRQVIVTEGIFSMDGDQARLSEICNLAKCHDSIVVVDDAHGDFIFGSDFSGMPSHSKINNIVDVHISSLSKGLGCFGGYVATNSRIRELLINTSRQFIYTSALPAHLSAAALAAISLAKKGNLQRRLFKNTSLFKKAMSKAGFDLGASSSQIIPIMIGDEKLAVSFSQDLTKSGIFAQAVRYPTVKKGSARLRVSITALHSENDIISAIDSFEKVGKKYQIV